MAQYLLALYKADNEQRPPEQTQRVWADVNALGDKITESGVFVFQGGLQGGPESATVVRQSGDDFVMTDGPYTETKEQIGGFWVIKCADLDAALEWARKGSAACAGAVEVRPFQEDSEA
jgi:hypothetical protein